MGGFLRSRPPVTINFFKTMSETALLDEIPSLDLSDFTSGGPERKAKFVRDLGTAFNNIGFVSIKNHGLTEELRNKLTPCLVSHDDLRGAIRDRA